MDIAQQRADLAERKCVLLEKVETEIKERLNTVDKLYIDSMEEVMRLRESEMEIKNSFEVNRSIQETRGGILITYVFLLF